jgi:hypothetical protein
MMGSNVVARFGALALAGALVVTAACERTGTEPDPHFDDVVRVNLIDRATGETLAHTHGEGEAMHWDGDLGHLHVGEELVVDVEFIARGGHVVPLGSEWTVMACPEVHWTGSRCDGDSDGVISVHPHGNHVDIEADAEGESAVVFALWHGGHSDWAGAPAVGIEVDDH